MPAGSRSWRRAQRGNRYRAMSTARSLPAAVRPIGKERAKASVSFKSPPTAATGCPAAAFARPCAVRRFIGPTGWARSSSCWSMVASILPPANPARRALRLGASCPGGRRLGGLLALLRFEKLASDMDDRVQPLGQGLFDGVRFLGLDPGGAEFGTLRTLNHVTEQALHLLECRLDYRPSLLEHGDRVALCRQQELDVVEEAGHVGRLGTDLCGIGRPQLAGDVNHPVAVLCKCLGRFRGETCLGRLRDVSKGPVDHGELTEESLVAHRRREDGRHLAGAARLQTAGGFSMRDLLIPRTGGGVGVLLEAVERHLFCGDLL